MSLTREASRPELPARTFWWDRTRPRDVDACPLQAVIFGLDALADGDCVLDADVTPRPGLIDLVMSLFVAGVWVAVAAPGRRAWVQPLVRQLIGDGLVETIVTSDDLTADDRGVHTLALRELGLTAPAALAIVGSAASLRAATGAGLPTVLITRPPVRCPGAVAVRSEFDGANPLLAPGCQRLHARWWAAVSKARLRTR